MNDESQDEYHLKVMRLIQKNPQISQRELAEQLGISLGKTNYCIQALIKKGLVKLQNFRSSQSKRGYVYLLTPEGVSSKARLTMLYLKIRMREYDALSKEIESLRSDLENVSPVGRKD